MIEQLSLEDLGLVDALQRPPSPASKPPRPAKRGAQATTRVPLALLKAMPLLDGAELKVFLSLAAHAEGPNREVGTLSVTQIASSTGLCARMVQKALSALEGHGLVCRWYHSGKRTVYRLKAKSRLRSSMS